MKRVTILGAIVGLAASSSLWAQEANEEISRMITAKLPEAAVIAKINDLRAGVDKSMAALAKLRDVGASDTILAAVLSEKSIPIPGATANLLPPLKFNAAEVEFISLLVSNDAIRVNLQVRNTSNAPVYLWNGSDTGESCEQVSLTDDEGNDFKCSADPLWAMGPHSAGENGKAIQTDTPFAVQYVFSRTGQSVGQRFNFSTSPFLSIHKDKSEYAQIAYPMRNDKFRYETLGISFSDLPAKVRPATK